MKLALHWQILIAVLFGSLAGFIVSDEASALGVSFAPSLHGYLMPAYVFLGTLFLNALKMVIVPLIASSIISGIANIGQDGAFARLGLKTLLYYATTSLFAILIGLMVVNLIQPGYQDGVPLTEVLHIEVDQSELAATEQKVSGKGASDIAEIFLRMVPTNIVSAAADGQMLGLIFFCLVFGFFMTKVAQRQQSVLQDFWQGIFETMMLVTLWIMKFAPIGVFALVAKVVAVTGFSAFGNVLTFFVTTLLALALHLLVTMPLLLYFVGGINPIKHYRVMFPALLTAFSTASSSATLPVTLECIEKKAKVSNRTSSFVLPLGATVNMDGTALYECVAAMFLAQAYGLELSFSVQFTIVLVALLTSIGVAGIPSASLVAISIIMATIGLPFEAIGLLFITDRILDMCRTAVNVFSDSCGAVIIARREGETQVLRD